MDLTKDINESLVWSVFDVGCGGAVALVTLEKRVKLRSSAKATTALA